MAKNKVLVVEDEPALRKSYTRWLAAKGLEVVEPPAFSIPEIIGAFEDYSQDMVCVICDGNLDTYFNGLDVVKAIRACDENVKIITITSDDNLAEQMLEAGANQRLNKPFEFDEFMRVVTG